MAARTASAAGTSEWYAGLGAWFLGSASGGGGTAELGVGASAKWGVGGGGVHMSATLVGLAEPPAPPPKVSASAPPQTAFPLALGQGAAPRPHSPIAPWWSLLAGAAPLAPWQHKAPPGRSQRVAEDLPR